MECRLGPLSDSPQTSSEFRLPTPLALIHEDSPGRLAGRLRSAMAAARPEVVLLYGDLDVTLLALGVANRLGVPTVHVESGYRTGDIADREEFTRVAVSHGVAHRVVFTKSMEANLRAEGIEPHTISHFGNPVVHALADRLAESQGYAPRPPDGPERGLVLFHREETVLDRNRLTRVIDHIEALSARFALTVVLFRRTDQQLRALGIRARLDRVAATAPTVRLTPTLRHAEYVGELNRASFVLTDSSTVQDECAFLRIPCFVLRRTSPRAADFPPTTMLVNHCEPAELAALVTAAVRNEPPAPPDVERLGPAYDASFADLLHRLTHPQQVAV
ncbi:UDP-N-acetylglucosamine 2-epimerase [Kitasatospora sp. NPDC058063]|uniref:UDP-N-acetylglucosamine 2-epimerase n=1 Tax=unclassified Kitasatospora TaxID=2633591 RepID=UPI0036DC75D3